MEHRRNYAVVRTNVQIKLSKKEGSQRHGAKRKLSSSKRCVLHLSIKRECAGSRGDEGQTDAAEKDVLIKSSKVESVGGMGQGQTIRNRKEECALSTVQRL